MHPEYADYWVKVADVFEQLAKSSTFFLEHCNVEDKKESNSLSDIWYFVDLLKESFITENFGENEENEQLEHNNEMNLYDYQTNEAFSFVQERLDEEVCVDTIEAVVKKFTDLTVTSNARRENNYHLKTCKYCQIGLTSSSLARLKNNDGDPNSSPFSDDWSLFTSLTSQWDHSQDRRSIIAHYISWHHIMRLTHWFALGKAWYVSIYLVKVFSHRSLACLFCFAIRILLVSNLKLLMNSWKILGCGSFYMENSGKDVAIDASRKLFLYLIIFYS